MLFYHCMNNEINMKNDYKRAVAFGQYIYSLCYKQSVSISKGKYNNVVKTDEDPRWWP